ncbi:PREDICTED: Bardet-Biedl syndrome 4 protein homolog [Nicrophorus vespilloides]|uniref:Bardet-Biedl syndrome 4 protein homolog n=1 Tax=Nicrophorus vespilloides TaxID=110193 RepID=A0ABM1MKS8_NICVS|nr:PREDICTED: Bardet-Biedl syndrome 4 protein homolog [Nicrophorus vespilloides]
MSLLANGNIKSADRKEGRLTEDPEPIGRLNWLIHLIHVRGDAVSCKDLIRNEIDASQGKNEFAHYKKAIILREEGKVQESLEAFQICHKLDMEDVDNLKEIGKCLFMLRRYRLALEAYSEAEKVASKSDWEIYHKIAECYMQLNDINMAKENANKAIKLSHQENVFSLFIQILCAEGNFNGAIDVCNKAVASCPDSVNVLTKSGLLYLKVGINQHAFERLSSALALDPLNPRALLGIGCITQNHAEYDVALSKYKIAVQSDTESVALWNNIGLCFYSKQKYIAAVTCLKRALWLSPMNWKVLLNLGLLHLATSQPASAFNFLCSAVNLRPDLGLPFMILACALLELNDTENALRAMRQAIALNGDEPLILANTCLCLLLAGHREAAKEIMNQIKENEEINNSELNALLKNLDITLDGDEHTELLVTNSGNEIIDSTENFDGDEDLV